MNRGFFTYIIFFAVLFLNSGVAAQNNKCGYPNYFPKLYDVHSYTDTCGKEGLLFRRTYYASSTPKWYMQGKIIRSTTPIDSVYMGANGVIITVSYVNCDWFNLTTKSYWKFYHDTGGWRDENTINIQDLRDSVNVWKKKNTFQDSLIAEKGLKANGLISATKGLTSDSTITSKGVNTEGSTNKAAAQFKGVLSMKDTIITSNYTANGGYGRITGDCASNNIVLTLPVPSAENLGWCYELSKKDASTFNFRITQGTLTHVIFSPNKIVRVRQKGGVWDLD